MRPELRSTRRGWTMIFRAAPDDKAGGGGEQQQQQQEQQQQEQAQPVDYKAALIKLLGLDASADDAAIQAKATEVQGTLAKVPQLETDAAGASDASTKLAGANTELERVRGEYARLEAENQAAYKAKQEAEVDAILEQYADRLTDEKAKARIRAILVSDREAGMEILNGLPAAAAALPGSQEEKKVPPAPKHDPANQEMTEEQKLAAQNDLIATIRKEGKFKDYDSARDEARRRKPELFS